MRGADGTTRWAYACGATGALAAAAIAVFGPPGVDEPAHLFQTWAFAHFGFQIWNNYWYAGRYQFVTYSLLFYPMAATVGLTPLAIGSAAVMSGEFAALAIGRWGAAARAPAIVFALSSTAVLMVSGLYPFLTGLALAMAALNAIRRRPWPWFVLLAAASAAASPLALLMLLVVLATRVVEDPGPARLLARYRVQAIAIGVLVLIGGVWSRMFSTGSFYAYAPTDLATIAGFTAAGVYLTGVRGRASELRAFFVVYLITNLAAFLVPSPVGSNAIRLTTIAAAPILWIAARTGRARPPGEVAVIVGVALAVQMAPAVVSAYTADTQSAASPAFWVPVERFLQARRRTPYRVEVVATWGHWESYYLAKDGILLARGWYRQDDYPLNRVLYRGDELTPRAYTRWLHEMAVRYVFLPSGALDYTAQSEAALLRSGRSGLPVVARLPHWTVYRVTDPTGLLTPSVSGSARLLRIGAGAIQLYVARPGTSILRVRYTPYWDVSPGVCLSQAPLDMTSITSSTTGDVTLAIDPSLTAVEQAIDGGGPTCPAQPSR